MSDTNIRQCPVCQVKIEGSCVLFSYGPPGSLERLSARVCRYANKPGCINEGIPDSELKAEDGYLTPEDIKSWQNIRLSNSIKGSPDIWI